MAANPTGAPSPSALVHPRPSPPLRGSGAGSGAGAGTAAAALHVSAVAAVQSIVCASRGCAAHLYSVYNEYLHVVRELEDLNLWILLVVSRF